MKAIIVYYSMSGNTRKIAHTIRKGMLEKIDQVDIVSIQGARGVPGMRMGHLLEYDLIGFGAPVWRGTLTPNMYYFIHSVISREVQFMYNYCFEKKLPREEKQQCFFFLTHGKAPGESIKRTYKLLEDRGMNIIGWDDWYGDSTMTYAQKPWQTEGHPDEIAFQQAEEFGKNMAERSIRVSNGEIDLIPELPDGQDYVDLYGIGYSPDLPMKWIGHHYGVKIIKEKCTKCGLCEENCPMDAIDLEAENPILPSCMWCTTCEMICPEGAVDINMPALKKDRGETKKEIYEKAQELQAFFVEQQNKLRPEKRMRYHVDPEELWMKGYVADITDSPRIVIEKDRWKIKK